MTRGSCPLLPRLRQVFIDADAELLDTRDPCVALEGRDGTGAVGLCQRCLIHPAALLQALVAQEQGS